MPSKLQGVNRAGRHSAPGRRSVANSLSSHEPRQAPRHQETGRLTPVAGLANRLGTQESDQPPVAFALGALGDFTAVVLADGTVRGFELSAG
jgi:hypothetical protein